MRLQSPGKSFNLNGLSEISSYYAFNNCTVLVYRFYATVNNSHTFFNYLFYKTYKCHRLNENFCCYIV